MDPFNTHELNTIQKQAAIGKAIPDFEFEAFHHEEIKKMSFSALKGMWLILFFYPADFTFICPTELEEMAKYHEEFKKLNAEVLSISTDTVWVHKAWHDHSATIKKIKFPMVADPSGKISRAYGTYVAHEGMVLTEDEGLSLRGTFVVDPDGILQVLEIHANNIGRSAKELMRKLQAAKFVHDHGGQVCPASWEPGDDTFTPGLDLVGKL